MPSLLQPNIKKIDLPSSTADDPAWVELNLTIDAGTAVAASAVADGDQSKATMGILSDLIVDWNFVDGDGNKEPITPDTVGHLRQEDFRQITSEIGKAMKDQGSSEVPLEQKKA